MSYESEVSTDPLVNRIRARREKQSRWQALSEDLMGSPFNDRERSQLLFADFAQSVLRFFAGPFVKRRH